jgi:hypothetical protein
VKLRRALKEPLKNAVRRFFNPEPRENLGSGSGYLKFLLGGFRLKTSFFSESLRLETRDTLYYNKLTHVFT